MVWLPIAAWGLAALVAVVVLGFCAYELMWKSRRLQRDLGTLNQLTERLTGLRQELSDAQRRVSGLR